MTPSPGRAPLELFFGALHRFGHVQAGVGRQPGAFKLNCGVADLKFLGENFAYLRQKFFTLFQVHVRDAYMAGKRVEVGAERPDVDVVNFLDAFDSQ